LREQVISIRKANQRGISLGDGKNILPPWLRILSVDIARKTKESGAYRAIAKYRILKDGSMEFLGKVTLEENK